MPPPVAEPRSPIRSSVSNAMGERSPRLFVLAEDGMPDDRMDEMPLNQPGSMAMSVQSARTSASATLDWSSTRVSRLPLVDPPRQAVGPGQAAVSRDPSLVSGLLSTGGGGRPSGRLSLGGARAGLRRRIGSDAQSVGGYRRPLSPSGLGSRSRFYAGSKGMSAWGQGGFQVGGRVGSRVGYGAGYVSGAGSVSGRSMASQKSSHSIKSEIPMIVNKRTGSIMPLAVARARKESIDETAAPLETTFGALTRVSGSRRAGSVSGARSAIGGPMAQRSGYTYGQEGWQHGHSPSQSA